MKMMKGARRAHMLRNIITAVCVICLFVSSCTIVADLIDNHNDQQKLEEIQSLYPGSHAHDDEEDSAAVWNLPDMLFPTALAEEEVRAIQDDFVDLYNANNDLVGWLDLGSSISQPVVQSDNRFYLTHDIYGNEDDAGTLFVNEANTLWPKDQNILIHGHNMRSGTSLGTMDNFRKAEWLYDNPLAYLRLIDEAEAQAYVPIAFFDASMDSGKNGYFDIGHIVFDDENHFNEYVNGVKERSLYQIDVDVTPEDQLLTVITCSYVYDNSRFIMVARALREDETVEDMSAIVRAAAQ